MYYRQFIIQYINFLHQFADFGTFFLQFAWSDPPPPIASPAPSYRGGGRPGGAAGVRVGPADGQPGAGQGDGAVRHPADAPARQGSIPHSLGGGRRWWITTPWQLVPQGVWGGMGAGLPRFPVRS